MGSLQSLLQDADTFYVPNSNKISQNSSILFWNRTIWSSSDLKDRAADLNLRIYKTAILHR